MSAFNLARYNLAKYNVSASDQIWLEGHASASFSFSFTGETIYFRGNGLERFLADNLQLNRGRIFQGSASETFSQQTNIIGYCGLEGHGGETINAETNLSQQVYMAGSIAEDFIAKLNLSQVVSLISAPSESLDTELNLSQKVWTAVDFGEVFAATTNAEALAEYVCEFPNLILQPGQALVIDAGAYNVLLDGQNAIHLQRGEWLDNLNRNTQSIVITGTGAVRLTAEILYTEKYL